MMESNARTILAHTVYVYIRCPFRPSNNHHRDHFNLAGDPNLNLYLPRLHPGGEGSSIPVHSTPEVEHWSVTDSEAIDFNRHFCWSGTLALGCPWVVWNSRPGPWNKFQTASSCWHPKNRGILLGQGGRWINTFFSSQPWGRTGDFDFSCVKRLSITESQSGHYETIYETFGPARTFLYMMMSLLCKALLSFVTPWQEGKPQTLQVMKHFLQRFEPGVDRLDGVEHIEGTNGAAILRCGSWKIPGRNLGCLPGLPVDSSDIGCLPVDMENLLRLLADSGRNRGLFMKWSEKFGVFFPPKLNLKTLRKMWGRICLSYIFAKKTGIGSSSWFLAIILHTPMMENSATP